MTEAAVLENEVNDDVYCGGNCKVDVDMDAWKDEVSEKLECRLEMFVDAIQKTENLEIIGTTNLDDPHIHDDIKNDAVMVIQNNSLKEKTLGHQSNVEIAAILEKCDNEAHTQDFINAILDERSSTVLHKITRIVGYYSRTDNWNKSKIGELRDRMKGNYNTPGFEAKYETDTRNAIDNSS